MSDSFTFHSDAHDSCLNICHVKHVSDDSHICTDLNQELYHDNMNN